VVDRAGLEFQRQIADLITSRDSFFSSAVPILERLVTLPSWGDVKSLSSYGDKVDLYLSIDKRDSALPREIAMEFGAKGEKRPGGDTLYVHFDLGTVRLDVNGYVPTTCKIVEVEEYVPGEIRKVKKVVCTEEPTGV